MLSQIISKLTFCKRNFNAKNYNDESYMIIILANSANAILTAFWNGSYQCELQSRRNDFMNCGSTAN